MSSNYPTLFDCLSGFEQRIQCDHGPTCVTTVHVLQSVDDHVVSKKRPSDEGTVPLITTEVLVLNMKIKMIQEHTTQANKSPLETEKGTRYDIKLFLGY
jgi:hypothetical protein